MPSQTRPPKVGRWSEPALRVLRERYLARVGEDVAETPEEMCWRVALAIAAAETRFGRSAAAVSEVAAAFYDMMVDGYFLPNSPTLMNAGKENQLQYSACYVLPIGDSMREIFDSVKAAAIIHQSGGGTGFSFSRLRPKNDLVSSTGGRASGPVSFLRVFNAATEAVKQGGCVAPDTRVSTSRGIVPIRTLGPAAAPDDSWHPHRGRLDVATDEGPRESDEFYSHGRAPVRKIITRNGYSLCATTEHRLRVIASDGEYAWRAVGDIGIGDWVALQKRTYLPVEGNEFPVFDVAPHLNAAPIRIPEGPTRELGEFIGYLLGDGPLSVDARGTGRLILTVCQAERDVGEHLSRIGEQLFGLRSSRQQKPGDGSTSYIFASATLVAWLRAIGVETPRSIDVRLPDLAFTAGPDFARAILRGLFTADGTVTPEGYPSLVSASKGLIDDVQQLLLALGMPSGVRMKRRGRGRFGQNPVYHLRVITGDGVRVFAEEIAFFASAKRERLKASGSKAWEFNDVIPYQGALLRRLYRGPGRGCGPGRTSRGANRRLYRAIQHYLPRVAAPRHVVRSRLRKLAAGHPEIGGAPGVQWFLANEQFYDEVVKVEEGESPTLDLSVPANNTYIANGFVSHNTRRGANMGILRVDHPDVLEFIECKLDGGITNFNISVAATDAFMDALARGGDYELVNPRTGVAAGTLSAREVFDRIVRAAWRTGDPGMIFIDRINRSPANPTPELESIEATNPCVTGATLVYTALGLIRVDELARRREAVDTTLDSRFDAGEWGTASSVFESGIKPVHRLLTEEGYELRLTGDHRLMTARGWRRADELEGGDRLHLVNRKGGFGAEGTLAEGRVVGWLVGGGHITADGCAVLSFFGDEKRELAPLFAAHVNDVIGSGPGGRSHLSAAEIPGRDEARVDSTRLARLVREKYGMTPATRLAGVPLRLFSGSEDLQKGFLQALFTADGHVRGRDESGVSARLTSISLPLLKDVQRMLLNFGIASRLYASRHAARTVERPDGRGGAKEYDAGADHDLVVARDNLVRFAREVGFLTNRAQGRLRRLGAWPSRRPHRETFTCRFKALDPVGVEPVFDLKEPLTRSFVANGLVVHNCGEQSLPPFDACNLGSINVARFARPADGAGATIDWSELERVIRLAVRFLDDVIEVNPYPLAQIDATVKANRRIGLGIMGWADLLFTLGIPYDSQAALDLADRLMGFVKEKGHEQSARLAEERGPFPNWRHSTYREGRLLRNCTVTTIAPTGTISMIAGCSSGIEPVFALAFEHRVKGADGERVLTFVSDTFERLAKARGFYSDAVMAEVARHGSIQHAPGVDEAVKAVFKTAHEVDWTWHVRHQAAFQKHADNGVSKTVNLPREAGEGDVAGAYLLAWQEGCLGITVFRDGCKGNQVLHAGVRPGDESGPETSVLGERVVKPRPHSLAGTTYRMETPIGTAFVTVNDTAGGEPFEVFVQVGKAGSDTMAVAEALGRLVSLVLRLPSPLSAGRRLEEVISQLSLIGGGQPTGFGPSKILSLPDALARVLGEHIGRGTADSNRALAAAAGARRVGDLCRECGQATLVYEEGCKKCVSCGYNEC